jgi:hypothetical protein
LQYWNLKKPETSIDILDIGYWYKDTDGTEKYSPAENDHREFIKKIQTENEG